MELNNRWISDSSETLDYPEYLCAQCGAEYADLALNWNGTLISSAPVTLRDLPDDTLMSIPWCDFCAESVDTGSPRLLHMHQFADDIEEWGCYLFCPSCAQVLENFFGGFDAGGDA